MNPERFTRRAFLEGSVLAGAAIVLPSCKRVKTKAQIETLDSTVRTYEKLLRWAEYREAANYISLREGERRPVDFADLEPIRITAFRSLKRVVGDGGESALIIVEMDFYHEDLGVVRTMEYSQRWYFDAEEKHWLLDSDLPDFLGKLQGGR